jgi:hypothetical protein
MPLGWSSFSIAVTHRARLLCCAGRMAAMAQAAEVLEAVVVGTAHVVDLHPVGAAALHTPAAVTLSDGCSDGGPVGWQWCGAPAVLAPRHQAGPAW